VHDGCCWSKPALIAAGHRRTASPPGGRLLPLGELTSDPSGSDSDDVKALKFPQFVREAQDAFEDPFVVLAEGRCRAP
jgi:hypothetical protein